METAAAKHPQTEPRPSLAFFFPYREISGVPMLFLRMADFLASRRGMNACVVDYRDGYMARALRERGSPVRVRIFEDGVPFEIGPETVLVLQSILPYTLRPELRIDPDTRIVFWTLYHLNLVQTIIPTPFFRHIQARYILFHRLFMNTLMLPLKRRMQEHVSAMNARRSLFFMDGSTLQYTEERLEIRIEKPLFVPLPCDDVPRNLKAPRKPGESRPLSVCWVGRLSDFKTPILLYTVRRLSDLARRKSIAIRFHIIGDGPDEALVRGLNVDHDHFRLTREGVIAGEDLDSFLLDRIDVLAAMGTSALEGAKLGVPTVLLDASYGAVNGDYRFRWLFESRDFGLADLMDATHFARGNDSLERVIGAALGDYSALSARTHEYCFRNHSISSVCDRFLASLEQATFRYRDFSPEILRKGWVRRSYERMRDGR